MSETIKHEPAKNFCADSRRLSGRVHLPVAPEALARVRFTPDQPLARALSPEQALDWLDYLAQEGESIKVVNINGPGDPLATPDLTLHTLNVVRKKFPHASLCLTCLGLGGAGLARRFVEPSLAHVSVLLDAVDPEVAVKIYAWIRPGKKTVPLAEAAPILIEQQASAIAALAGQGITVQVKTTVYPGINAKHIVEVAETAAGLGAGEMKLFPFQIMGDNCPRPVDEADSAELERLAGLADKHLPTRLVDLASCQNTIEFDFNNTADSTATLPKPTHKRPHLAVCSSNGFEVDLHLGQTAQYLIYGPKNGPVVLRETRRAPQPGKGAARWQETALALNDCFAVLAVAAGEAPKRIMAENGLKVLSQEGNVEGFVDVLYGGGKKPGNKK